MLSGIFDTHTHYDHPRFDYIRHASLGRMPGCGVALVLGCGSDLASSAFTAELAGQYPFFYGAAGIHPGAASETDDGWQAEIEALLLRPRMVAVGEIGLDYHYGRSDRETQRKVFRQSLDIALKLALPVIVHDRDAHGDILAMLREYRPKGVVHRFSGSPDMAGNLMEIGLLLGFGCSVTYENAVLERETLKLIPPESLLLETDCPYLPPAQFKGELCFSDMLTFAAETISRIRPEFTAQQIVDIARRNGERLFGVC